MSVLPLIDKLVHNWDFFGDTSTVRTAIKKTVLTETHYHHHEGAYYHFKGISEYPLCVRAPKLVIERVNDLLPYGTLFLFDGKATQSAPVEMYHAELLQVTSHYLSKLRLTATVSISALVWELILVWANEALAMKKRAA